MSYATYSDVQDQFPYVTFGASTKPTQSAVTEMIEDIEAELDGTIRAVHNVTVPLTDSRDVSLMRRIVVDIVRAMAYEAAYRAESMPDWVTQAHERYEAKLDRLERRKLIPPSFKTSKGVGIVTIRRRNDDGTEYTGGEDYD